MGSHPANLAVRFLLELVALVALGRWGWVRGTGGWRYVLAPGVPVLAALLWGTFAVPGDASRSGEAVVPVPGFVRLALEIAVFCLATWALIATDLAMWGWVFGAVVLIHYAASYDRVVWLMRQP
jgi:hypothetical protein